MEGDDEIVFRHACKLGLESCVVSPLPTLKGGTLLHYPAKSWQRRMEKSPGRVPGL
jgi:hypothetical protein